MVKIIKIINENNFEENDYYNQSFQEEDDNENLSYFYESILPCDTNLENNFYNLRNSNDIYKKSKN